MTDRATLQVKDAQGTPDMVLVLTDNQELVLRGAEVLEREVEQAEQSADVGVSGSNLISRLLRYLVNHEMEETEQAIERLAAGVPLTQVEEMGLDSSGFKIRLKGHAHAPIHLSSDAIEWVEASTFVQQVDEMRSQSTA
jgi:hypothetical protein